MRRILVPTLTLALLGGAALAQTAPNPDMAVAAAKNQLGVLEYCQAEGHIDGKAAETQGKIMAMLPAAQDAAAVEAAYEKGKTGTVSAMGVEQSLADAAKAQGAEVAALCTQIAAAVEQAAAQLPQ
ncbi:pore-forming ESAT-6 family protein [Paracoccus sp. TOH]|uniref:Pore-forming ESAT-6 family protein n=1 Tax=Paracoccus simplex TaxID=2086346 RepID=A0ABV7RYW5_9RHOB|nr:pore-forming ESAT-6 family protein [Paracoccus sp. TOH]WJS85571.1 pore-forming ESAT-6 family protein [Paracoccus sp. TOH]